MIKNEKGITLIALVITVIILIILAGISISSITGDESALSNSKKAKKETEISAYEDQLEVIRAKAYAKDVTQSDVIEFLNDYANDIRQDKMFQDAKEITVDEENKVIKIITKEGYEIETSMPLIDDEQEIDINQVTLTIGKEPTEWTQGPVKVTLTTNFNINIKKEYSLDGGNSWIEYTEPFNVENNGVEVQAKAINQANEETDIVTEKIDNIDREKPLDFTPKITATKGGILIETIAEDATATSINGKSGIQGYQFSLDDGKTWTNTRTSGTAEFNNLVEGSTYLVKVKAIDNARNETVSATIPAIPNSEVPSANGKITFAKQPADGWTKSVSVTINSTESNYKIQYSSNGKDYYEYNGPITITRNGTIYARYVENQTYGEATSDTITNIDTLKPKDFSVQVIEKTTTTITVKGDATDAEATQESGCSGIRGYRFSSDGGENWTQEITNNEYEFKGLKQNTPYEIKIKAIDNAGNEKETEIENVQTGTLPNVSEIIKFHRDPDEWTQGPVKVTIEGEADGYILEYSTDNISWKTYFASEGVQVENNNDIVYARFRNPNTNETTDVMGHKVTNIDRLPPNKFTPSLTSNGNQITVTCNVTDAPETNIDACSEIKEYEYIISGRTGSVTRSSNIYTFAGLIPGEKYTITVKARDFAGNEIESYPVEYTIQSIPDADGNITFSYSENGWTKNDVIVTITSFASSTYTLQFSYDGSRWYDYDSSNKPELSANGPIYARLRDEYGNFGTQITGGYYRIDKELPTANYDTFYIGDTEAMIYLYPTDTGGSGLDNNSITCTPSENVQKINSTSFSITANGTYTFTFYDNARNEGSVTIVIENLIEKQLKIGDYINYVPDGEQTVTSNDLGTSNTMSVQDFKWIVFDIKNDGTVELIAENETESRISLMGTNGYNNGVYVMNQMCNSLYKNEGIGATARNIKIEDITDKIEEDFDYIQTPSGYSTYGLTLHLDGQHNYPLIWKQEEGSENKVDTINNNGTLGASQQENIVSGSEKANQSIDIKVNYFTLNSQTQNHMKPVETQNSTEDTDFYFDLLSNSSNFYSTRAVRYDSNTSKLEFCLYKGFEIGASKIYSSINEDGYITGVFGSLRPIVTLPYSSIDFSVGDGQENSAWGIK